MRRDLGLFSAGSLIFVVLVIAAAPLGAQSKTSKTSKTSVCRDGSTSAVTGPRACSGHGGVDSVATAAAKKARKAAKADAKADKAKASKDPEKAAAAAAAAKKANAKAIKAEEKAAHDSVGATAQCKDGTYSHSTASTAMQTACSRHGGVSRTIKR
jgi:nucleoid-associated protein YgaU